MCSAGFVADAGVLPCRDVREVLVIAQRLAVRRLALLAEVAAAGLGAVQSVRADQFAEFEEVRDASRLFERLVQFLVLTEHIDVLPELLAQLRDLRERLPQARVGAGHAAVVPHDVAEFAVEGVHRPLALDAQEPLDARVHLAPRPPRRRGASYPPSSVSRSRGSRRSCTAG